MIRDVQNNARPLVLLQADHPRNPPPPVDTAPFEALLRFIRGVMVPTLAVMITSLLAGCADLAYYAQAVGGHSAMLQAARPIPALLADPALEAGLRARLEEARVIRAFASNELGLPDNGSYESYADLGRPYVVWNVFAAPEFSLDLEKWCFVVVGCVSYRGYYREEEARAFAKALRVRGLDVEVGGVAAYSTLGFHPDPLLNTFLGSGDNDTARTVFHELAHQRLFVKNDPAFSESFATAVEQEGLRRWLAASGDGSSLAHLARRKQRQAAFDARIAESRTRLLLLYASTVSAEEKRRAKAAIMAGLANAASDFLPARPAFNNAALGALGLYRRWVPAFEALLRSTDGDLPSFYRKASALARLPAPKREAALTLLLATGEM